MRDRGALIGQRIGVYRIDALLGAGGMGTVYRAHDTRLRRDVAIKILPESFTSDPDRRNRFDQEARLLAALNHPNIAAIYGIEDHPPGLVLELVEGDTLTERIASAQLTVASSLEIARQLMKALDAAHEKGIVHRDLKPSNIAITRDGTVKVLDFGVAKVLRDDLDGATTVTAHQTRVGTVIGTPAYMSPEQARGLNVDKRADIWAFGCVLFEMLAGRAPFARATVTDTFAAILGQEPEWPLLPVGVPPRVRALLARCLEKDSSARLRDIGDASADLDDRAGSHVERRRPGRRLAAGIVVVAMLALGSLLTLGRASWLRFRAGPQSQVTITDLSLESPQIAFSPDGSSLVIQRRFDKREPLIVRRLDSNTTRELPGTDGGLFPFWSPDGRSIAFFTDRKLKRIDLIGEAVQEIADAPVGRGGAWTADDQILFVPSATSAIYRVSANGGTPIQVTSLAAGQNDHRAPVILPDGRHFLYYARGLAGGRGVYVARIDGSEPHRLLDAAAAAVYSPAGYLLFLRENQLLAQRFDPVTLDLSGEPIHVADGVAVNRGVSLATLAASSAGGIAYATASTVHMQFAWFDRNGGKVGAIGSPDTAPFANPALSPDGRTVAFARLMDNSNWDICLMDTARGMLTRLTSEPALDFVPVWMPNSAELIYQSTRGISAQLYRRAIAQSDAQPLLTDDNVRSPLDVSRDGRFLLFSRITAGSDSDIWVMALDRSSAPRSLLSTRFTEGGAQFSTDGRWIAYTSNETGRYEIYVRPFSEPGAPQRVSTQGGNAPRWSHRGDELFYVDPDGRMMRAAVGGFRSPQLTLGEPQALFTTPLDPAGFAARAPYVLSVDDQRFLIPIATDQPTPMSLVVISNWRPRR